MNEIDVDLLYSYFFESNQTQNNGIATKFNMSSSWLVNFPINIEVYYISPEFVNIHSSIINGSVVAYL